MELATTPVLLLLISTLPSRAREPDADASNATAVPTTVSEGKPEPWGMPNAAWRAVRFNPRVETRIDPRADDSDPADPYRGTVTAIES